MVDIPLQGFGIESGMNSSRPNNPMRPKLNYCKEV